MSKSTVLSNISSNYILMIVRILITFIMTPLLVKNLGNKDYGVWELMISILGYMSILDLGLSPAISRYVARFETYPKKARQSLKSTSFIIMLCLGLLASILLLASWFIYASLLSNYSPAEFEKYLYLVILIALQLSFTFPAIALTSILEGLQLFSLKNNVSIISSLIFLACIFYTLQPENGLLILTAWACFFSFFRLVVYLFIFKLRLNVSLSLSQFSRSIASRLLHFTKGTFVLGVTHRLSDYSDKVIIAWLLNVNLIVFYSLPKALTNIVSNMIANITNVYLPVFSKAIATKSSSELTAAYLKASKYSYSLVLFAVINMFFLADNFISIWIGIEYGDKVSELIPYFCLYLTLYLFNPFDSKLATASSNHFYFARLSVIETFLSVFLSILLTQFLGLLGVVLGTILATLYGKVYKFFWCMHYLNLNAASFVIKSIKKNGIANISVIILLFALDSFAQNLLNFIIVILTSIALWAFLSILFLLEQTEKQLIYSRFRFKVDE